MIRRVRNKLPPLGILDKDPVKAIKQLQTWADALVRQLKEYDKFVIDDDTVTAAMIAANSIGSSELADNSVDTAAIIAAAVTVAKLGTDWPSVLVTHSAPAALTTAVVTTFTWNTENHDVGACHDNATNPSRLTAPIKGVYDVFGLIAWAANVTGERYLYLQKNGATIVAINTQKAMTTAGVGTYHRIGRPVKLAAGDYVEMQGFQNSGGNLAPIVGADYSPLFGMDFLHSY